MFPPYRLVIRVHPVAGNPVVWYGNMANKKSPLPTVGAEASVPVGLVVHDAYFVV